VSASPNYLALGDSIAFGFNPNLAYTAPFAGFVGYPEATSSEAGLRVANAACPGETSGSFLDANAPDNGCHSSPFYFNGGLLKVNYNGQRSQLDYAREFLTSGEQVELVTIDLGGNDLLLVQNGCGDTSNVLCIVEHLPGALAAFSSNLDKIFDALRSTGYRGRIVAVTQYATNYLDITQITALTALNTEVRAVALAHRVAVADGYAAFAAASFWSLGDPCKAGLLIKQSDGTCDKHPSEKGRDVLAKAVLEAAHSI
jgi:lysophospholipase L1-like esterase